MGGHRVSVLVLVVVLAGGPRQVAGAATHPYMNMGSHGIPWDPWDPWDPMGSHGMPWDAMGVHGIPWDPMGSRGIPWDPM